MEDKEADNKKEASVKVSEANGCGDSDEGLKYDEAPVPEERETEAEQAAAEQIEDVVAKYRAEAEANYDKYLRAVAELENFKKRAVKERSDLLKYSGESLARDVLDVVDNLQLALKHEGSGSVEEFLKGVRMVLDNLLNTLQRHGIVGEDAVGQVFDPQKHEAMAMVPMQGKEPGVIIEEFKRAYTFKDKLLRPAQVVVAAEQPKPVKGAEEGEEESGSCE